MGTIEDWYANRADGDMGSAPDDERVERMWVGEHPPELAPLPAEEFQRLRDDIDDLRQQNGLGAGRVRTGVPRTGTPAPRREPLPAPPDIPEHVRQRVLDLRRVHPLFSVKELHVEMLRRGSPGTRGQVQRVIAEDDDARRAATPTTVPAQYTKPRRNPGPLRAQPVCCAACGVRLGDRGLCSCS